MLWQPEALVSTYRGQVPTCNGWTHIWYIQLPVLDVRYIKRSLRVPLVYCKIYQMEGTPTPPYSPQSWKIMSEELWEAPFTGTTSTCVPTTGFVSTGEPISGFFSMGVPIEFLSESNFMFPSGFTSAPPITPNNFEFEYTSHPQCLPKFQEIVNATVHAKVSCHLHRHRPDTNHHPLISKHRHIISKYHPITMCPRNISNSWTT